LVPVDETRKRGFEKKTVRFLSGTLAWLYSRSGPAWGSCSIALTGNQQIASFCTKNHPDIAILKYPCQNWPTLLCFFADSGYAGWKLELALLQKMDDPPQIEIVRRADTATGFVVIAKCWVVARTFAWLGRCRRLAKDGETSRSASNAWLTIAAIRRQSRFIAKTIKSMS
jgi:transposase